MEMKDFAGDVRQQNFLGPDCICQVVNTAIIIRSTPALQQSQHFREAFKTLYYKIIKYPNSI